MLLLQAESLQDSHAVTALKDAESRVQSMLILYENLYQATNFHAISSQLYIPSLVKQVVSNFPKSDSIRIEMNIDHFVLEIRKVQPLGIIITELLTNIMKYAFIGRNDGVITVSATLNENRVSLLISDNGIGISDSLEFERSLGFGIMLVRRLTKQLQGTISFQRQNGTQVYLDFNL
jgi:two-component sensor histidine kinase